jgi:hypothetical protein
MPNYTFNIPIELLEQMKQHPEIKWSEILRQKIKTYLEKLDEKDEIKSTELLARLKIDLSEISEEDAIEFARAARIAGEKRVFTDSGDETQ